ncbi:hypothetical protein SAMD00019534_044480 [Acytostelium subglobosum LB1]|uniref:hypothetical protein n=1 Tax=Acytostelium subglobosum LB1 TaxID=1410327 RepID=UPI0006451861|nr:hypothetical protein SAMD00019534_044480 [Acytostelium subglobosum LB1]GAM21273.1 hypothetical protein SAMD00019534_044480 [Acytostelium subglobosum LB1]|eukprot:XP_012755392.1 hypothetical protein SAMD00019534_044480 [Acytostelium subglobosum LB1]
MSTATKPLTTMVSDVTTNSLMMNTFPMDSTQPLHPKTGKEPLASKLARWSKINYEHPEIRKVVAEVIKDKSLFFTGADLPKEKQRVQSLLQLKTFLAKIYGPGYVQISDLKGDPTKILAMGDVLSQFDDNSVSTKLVVNNYLFGGAVYTLGTEKHHRLIPGIQTGELLGCFAMTELGHGSNVRALETTATYDPETNEFIIQTPKRTATKWWIGNACHAVMSSVFARLIINGKDHEVHCFLVPIRKENGIDLMPGVRIGDCGPKFGLNGVDNGWIQFENVRIPYDNLLDKFGSIINGEYTSPIKSPSHRFANILSQMIAGRIFITFASVRSMKILTSIAIRYALKRLQFGSNPSAPETPILEYPTHYLTLMPMVASLYALDAVKSYLAKRFKDRSDGSEIHVLASGFKALTSHFTTVSALELRRLCGGHGYSAYSRFSILLATMDVGRTFEGDNTLLYQQVAKDLLTQFKKEYSSNKFTGTLKYLGKNTKLLLSEINPASSFMSKDSNMMNITFLCHCLEFRSSRLLLSSAKVVSKAYRQTKDAFVAWNQSLETLIHLAKSHTETIIATRFVDAVHSQKDPETREMLEKLCQLYLLTTIREDFEFFRGTSYLKKGQANVVGKLVSQLSLELSRHAQVLIDGFDNEKELIDAPIGLVDGDLYENICARVDKPFSLDNYPEEMRMKAKL